MDLGQFGTETERHSKSQATAQEEYAQEGIDWSYVEFVDNQDCLDLLETGIFPLIDESCRLPRATYQVRLSFYDPSSALLEGHIIQAFYAVQ